MLDDATMISPPSVSDTGEQHVRLDNPTAAPHAGGVELPVQRCAEQPSSHLQAFGRRLQRQRKSRGWSKRELGRRSRIDPSTITRIEAGKNITLEVLWRLASAFQVHWAELLDNRTTDPSAAPHPSVPFPQQLTSFGARVYQLRTQQRLLQRELASRAGTNRSTVFQLEAGKQNIKLDTAVRLAAGLGMHWADLLDDRQANLPAPEARLHAAVEQANRLEAQVEQLRAQLTLAHARAEVAESVAARLAPQRIADAAERAKLIFDQLDRPRLAAMNAKHLAAHLEARRTLYDYLDRIWRVGQRQHHDQLPEWVSVVALRDLAQHLTATVLDAQMRHN